MSELKDIVPPIELCRQIPKGAFADSALVWSDWRNGDGGKRGFAVYFREDLLWPKSTPAPTLAEIWNELPTVSNNRFLVMLDATNRGKGHQIGYARLIDGVLDSDGDFCTQDLNPAIAALWLWFRVKGASC